MESLRGGSVHASSRCPDSSAGSGFGDIKIRGVAPLSEPDETVEAFCGRRLDHMQFPYVYLSAIIYYILIYYKIIFWYNTQNGLPTGADKQKSR